MEKKQKKPFLFALSPIVHYSELETQPKDGAARTHCTEDCEGEIRRGASISTVSGETI